MTIELEAIPEIAREMAEQIRSRLPPVQRVESTADQDIALLFEMQAVMAAAMVTLSAKMSPKPT